MTDTLFASLCLDEDVSVLIAELLKRRGYTVATALETGQLGKKDSEQLAYAAHRGLAILTHNRGDFETLAREYVATGRSHCGIIAAVRRSPYEITRRLLKLLNQVTADELRDQLLYI